MWRNASKNKKLVRYNIIQKDLYLRAKIKFWDKQIKECFLYSIIYHPNDKKVSIWMAYWGFRILIAAERDHITNHAIDEKDWQKWART
jgi:hypothetical protein